MATMVAPQAKVQSAIQVESKQFCTGTCAPSPFGDVLLQQLGPNSVFVRVTLSPGEVFAGTGAGEALGFNLNSPAITPASAINIVTANFAVGPVNESFGGSVGTFQYTITCTTCSGGNAGNPAGPLTFVVTRAGGLTVSDFTLTSPQGMLFASDIAVLGSPTADRCLSGTN